MGEAVEDRPLAPTSEPDPISSTDEEETAASKLKATRKKRCIKCCACVTILLLIEAVVLIILIFTVFKIKNPIIKLNGFTVNRLDLVNGAGAIPMPRPGSNITITADVSVKNPNYASFKYQNTTTSLDYRGVTVGEARGPPGKAKARRTSRMNITVDIMTDKIVSSPMLVGDLSTGLLTIGSFTRVGGRVKIMKIVKRHVTVEMNCTVVVNITSRGIQTENCKRKVKL